MNTYICDGCKEEKEMPPHGIVIDGHIFDKLKSEHGEKYWEDDEAWLKITQSPDVDEKWCEDCDFTAKEDR